MSKRPKEQKLKELRKRTMMIERKLKDGKAVAEAKLLLYVLIYRFDGFARQQHLVNDLMSSRYHWGNKRTARVLVRLDGIGVIERSRSSADNWTLFFLVRGFLQRCRVRIERAALAIRKRLKLSRSVILSTSYLANKAPNPYGTYPG